MATVLNSVDTFLRYHGVNIPNMQELEFQVLADPEGGEPVEDRRGIYSDGVTEWWSIRCPRHADSEPDFSDYELEWRLDQHALSIGFTGWNWVKKQSVWLGFDFDSLKGHAEGVGLTDEQIREIQRRAMELDYVEVVRSTSGKGLHLYVYLEDGFSTENHTEHAALARAVIGVMSTECNFDLAADVDCMGSVLWKWSKNQSKNAFEVVKESTRKFTLSELPENWKDNLDVVTRRRSKVRVNGVEEQDQDFFDQMASGRKRVPLSDAHKEHIETLRTLGGTCIWVSDHHLLQTHTVLLKTLHQRLGLKGVFDTVSEGKDTGSPNAFMFPSENDSWVVVRFGRSVTEHQSWKTNSNGWTTCKLNADPEFETAMEFAGGGLLGDDRGFAFPTVDKAMAAIRSFGVEAPAVQAPLADRSCTVSLDKKKNILVQADKVKGDSGVAFAGWNDQEKKTKWSRVIRTTIVEEDEVGRHDTYLQRVISLDGSPYYRCPQGARLTESEAKGRLTLHGVEKTELLSEIGRLSYENYREVSVPWAAELLGDRKINVSACRLAYEPRDIPCPDYDRVFAHWGASLDPLIKANTDCHRMGIYTGVDYLWEWVRVGYRRPLQRRPGLCAMSRRQGTGKSSFHRMLGIPAEGASVDGALALKEKFNKAILGVPFVYFEDFNATKITDAKDTMNRLVESPTITGRSMRTDAVPVPNYSGLIFTTNRLNYLPLYVGDTRWTCFELQPLRDPVAWPEMQQRLQKQAPGFLHKIFSEDIRKPVGRLSPPVLDSELKQQMIAATNNTNDIVDAIICDHLGEAKSNQEWFQLMPKGAFTNKATMGKAFAQRGLIDHGKQGWEVPSDFNFALGA